MVSGKQLSKKQEEGLCLENNKKSRTMLIGAAFLMGVTAAGPGFLTQTAVFTQQYGASYSTIILLTIIVDVIAQVNVWRIVIASGKYGQEIANDVVPGLGTFVAILVFIGGIAFNIGNIAGTGMALNTMLGIDVRIGAAISAIIAIAIFLSKEFGNVMDKFAIVLGILKILLALFVAIAIHPPVGEAVSRTFVPQKFSFLPLVTLVGGTVGGYITFSGSHRYLQGNKKGIEFVKEATISAVLGILIAFILSYILFLGDLGTVVKGIKFDPINPAATPFRVVAGTFGYRLFGLMLWAAGSVSIVGCSFTSLSFIRTFFKSVEEHFQKFIVGFIVFCTIVFVTVGKPVSLLIFAGAVNGLILPLTLGSMLLASRNKNIVGEYRHPIVLLILGIFVFLLTLYGGISSLSGIKQLFK